MAFISYSLLAKRAIVDRLVNSLSVIEFIENVEMQVPPGFEMDEEGVGGLADFQNVAHIQNLDNDNDINGKISLILINPSREEMELAYADLTVRRGTAHRWTVNIESLPIKVNGVYVLRTIWSEGETKDTFDYHIRVSYKEVEGAKVLKPTETSHEG